MHNRNTIPIVALTAHAIKGDREKCIQSGMDEYLPKPINAADLAMILGKLLDDPQLPIYGMNMVEGSEKHTHNSSVAFNYDTLLQRLMGDQQLLATVVQMFVTDGPQHIKQLKNHFVDSDLNKMERLAHKLKGAAASVEAKTVERAAFKIEQQCKVSEKKHLPHTLQELEDEMNLATQQMKQSLTS